MALSSPAEDPAPGAPTGRNAVCTNGSGPVALRSRLRTRRSPDGGAYRTQVVPRLRLEVDDEVGTERTGDAVESDHRRRHHSPLEPGDRRLAHPGQIGELGLADPGSPTGGTDGTSHHDRGAGAFVASERVGSPGRGGSSRHTGGTRSSGAGGSVPRSSAWHIKDELY